LVAGFAFLGLAAYDYFSPAPQDLLEIEQPDLEVADLASGKEKVVVFRLENRSSRPLPVLGVTTC
jgi:hypothetical protein